MKVQSSLQSLYTSSYQSSSNSNSDDDTQFTLPDDMDDASSNDSSSTSVSSSGVPASISSFWINQANDPSYTGSDDGSSSDGSSGSESSAQSIEDEFANLANMTPAEKIREEYLEEQHLTEDQFNQLPSDQQQAINDAIAQQIKQKLGDDSSNSDSDASDSAASALTVG